MLEPPVPEVRLSDPCPCGSGRKYRRCCWARTRREFATALREIEEAPGLAAQAILRRYPSLPGETMDRLLEEVVAWAGAETVEKTMDEVSEIARIYGFEASLVDLPIEDGATLVELYLADPASQHLRPTTREYLEAFVRSAYSLYEVRDVQRGKTVTLEDLLRHKTLTVLDRHRGAALERNEVLFARVVETEPLAILPHLAFSFPRTFLEPFLERLPEIKRDNDGEGLGWLEFFKREWALVLAVWMSLNEEPSDPPVLMTTDGDPLVLIELVFEILPGKERELRRRLDGAGELRSAGDGLWSLVEQREGAVGDGVILAALMIEGDRMKVSVSSEPREAEVRQLLERVAGGCLGQVSRTARGVTPELLAELTGEDLEPEEPPVPPEVAEEAVHRVLERHYRDWVDRPVPALDDMTPRQAASDRRMRRRLVSLLKDLELGNARAGGPMATYDVSWLWSELGLKRP